MEWITRSMGRFCCPATGLTAGWIVTFTDWAAGCGATPFSGTCTIGVPQWLQNVEFRGTRFPQREQNEPEGRDEVSTGTGDTGLFSIILLSGREISIFFFTGRVPAITVRAGAGAATSGLRFRFLFLHRDISRVNYREP